MKAKFSSKKPFGRMMFFGKGCWTYTGEDTLDTMSRILAEIFSKFIGPK